MLCVYFVIIFLLYSFFYSLRANQLFEIGLTINRNEIESFDSHLVGVQESCGVIIIFLALKTINQKVLETRFSCDRLKQRRQNERTYLDVDLEDSISRKLNY